MNTGLNFPSGNPLDPSGNLTPQWRMFFLTLFTRSGGTAGSDTATLQAAITKANANIADLQSEDAQGDPAPDMAAVFGLIHVVEAIAAQAMAAASRQSDERGETGESASVTHLSQRVAEIEGQIEHYRADDALRQRIADLESRIESMQPVIADASQLTGLGTMATQNASAVAVTGGSGVFSSLASSTNTFIGNVSVLIAGATGRIFTAIRGSTGAGGIELSTSAVDADALLSGVIQAGDANGTGGERRLGMIQFLTNGATSTNRGGAIAFVTKADGGAVTEAGRFTNTQRLLLGTTTDNGTDRLQVNGSISMSPTTTTTAPAAGAAGALPATPTGYANITIGGTARKIAYY